MVAAFRISGQIKELDNAAPGISMLAEQMPTFVTYQGHWSGEFQHFGNDGRLLETHHGHVEHEFPETGPYDHIQHNHFVWDNGQEHVLEQKSVFCDNKLWWESGPFQGCIWETDFGTVLVNITQLSSPRLHLNEMICLEPNGNRRSRVKQWFKHGKLFRRTLCHEQRGSNEHSKSSWKQNQ